MSKNADGLASLKATLASMKQNMLRIPKDWETMDQDGKLGFIADNFHKAERTGDTQYRIWQANNENAQMSELDQHSTKEFLAEVLEVESYEITLSFGKRDSAIATSRKSRASKLTATRRPAMTR